MSIELLLEARLKHSALNSFLIEYEARKLGIETNRLPKNFLVCRGPGGKSALFRRACGPDVSRAAHGVTMNKYLTKRLWDQIGVSQNAYELVNVEDLDAAIRFAQSHDWQIVIKPVNGVSGKNVITNIDDEIELEHWWNVLRKTMPSQNVNILVERKFVGDDYRFFVVDGRVEGVLERVRPFITGDGVSTATELIDRKREIRDRNPDLYSRPIKVDDVVESNLGKADLTMDSVVPKGKTVVIRGNANISTGGEHRDRTDDVAARVRGLVERAVACVPNAATCAVDVLAKDITDDSDISSASIVLNEIETDGAMCMHHFPLYGTPRNLARRIILSYFPEADDGRSADPYIHDFDEHPSLTKDVLAGFCLDDGHPNP